MHVVILGGGGFLGSRLAWELLQTKNIGGNKLSRLTLVDRIFPEGIATDDRVDLKTVDFSDATVMENILRQKPEVIFHLAAVVSGEAEKNFDLGMTINFHASLQLLELCRKIEHCPRIVFASSCAVFGGDISKVVTDDTGPKPLSSYGTQKAMVELLMSDYSRRKLLMPGVCACPPLRCVRVNPMLLLRPL